MVQTNAIMRQTANALTTLEMQPYAPREAVSRTEESLTQPAPSSVSHIERCESQRLDQKVTYPTKHNRSIPDVVRRTKKCTRYGRADKRADAHTI